LLWLQLHTKFFNLTLGRRALQPERIISAINLKKENRKIYKYMVIKQDLPEQSVGQGRNQKGNKEMSETNENGNVIFQNI